MTKIPEITITNHNGFFAKKDFKWILKSPFSIIVGINGSGKTQLLKYIAESDNFNGNQLIRYIDVDYKPPLQKYGNELARAYNHSPLVKDGKYFIEDKNGQQNDWSSNIGAFKVNNVLNTLDYAIIDSVITKRKKFQNNTNSIREELDRIESFNKTFDIKDLLPKNRNDDEPWDRIDRIFNEFGLLIRVDRANLNAGLEFCRRFKSDLSEEKLEMKNLSSGEKVAFSLALWTWGNSQGQKTDILLVDEFDAHLNPSLIEGFIKIIKEYFIDLGVQVIMTTHHPSTVAYAHKAEADIVWMEDGMIDPEISYENIIRALSNGLIDVNNFIEDIQLLINQRDKKYVIYTEGKTDQKHLNSAIHALNRKKKFGEYYIFGCTGAETIPIFAALQTGQSKRIVLLDNDDKGQEVLRKIISNSDLKSKINKKRLAVVFVSLDDGKVIEDLFDQKWHPIGNKEKFASEMAKKENLTSENFSNFNSLLDRLLDAFPAVY